MWIRSQDKEILIDAKTVSHQAENTVYEKNIINGWLDGEGWFIIGKYETRERAIEVISEIQFQVQQGAKEKNWVYEMPEK